MLLHRPGALRCPPGLPKRHVHDSYVQSALSGRRAACSRRTWVPPSQAAASLGPEPAGEQEDGEDAPPSTASASEYQRYAERRRRRILERDADRLNQEEVARRAKIGAANKGRTPWNKGRKHSPGEQEACRYRAGVGSPPMGLLRTPLQRLRGVRGCMAAAPSAGWRHAAGCERCAIDPPRAASTAWDQLWWRDHTEHAGDVFKHCCPHVEPSRALRARRQQASLLPAPTNHAIRHSPATPRPSYAARTAHPRPTCIVVQRPLKRYAPPPSPRCWMRSGRRACARRMQRAAASSWTSTTG